MENIQNNKTGKLQSSRNTQGAARFPFISTIIAALCITLYLGALIQATVRIYLSVDKSRISAEREFSNISDIAVSAGMQGFMDQRFIDTMDNALTSSRNIEAIIITGPDGAYVFEKQKGYAVTWANNSPQFINRFSFSNQNYYRPLRIQGLRDVNIKAVANAYNLAEFTEILKHTLIIVLVGFVIAFFTMLLQLLLGKKETASIYPPSYDIDSHFADEAEMKLPEIGPKGLYSPRSNVGWEEYINDRLDSELHRCASSEKDLTFVIVEFSDLTNDSMLRQSAEEAVSSFSSRDLIFEFGRWGIAVILPGISLEAGISKSEHYYQRIMEEFPRGYKRTSNLSIGLTSRSGRLLNAGRIILEAREAVRRAKEDPKSPIIAFKSDPDKYREFISKN